MKCGNCKHWGDEELLSLDEKRPCQATTSDAQNPLAVVSSYWSDYGGCLQTAAEFGCVLFEAKEEVGGSN